jgi:hypothetical protein
MWLVVFLATVDAFACSCLLPECSDSIAVRDAVPANVGGIGAIACPGSDTKLEKKTGDRWIEVPHDRQWGGITTITPETPWQVGELFRLKVGNAQSHFEIHPPLEMSEVKVGVRPKVEQTEVRFAGGAGCTSRKMATKYEFQLQFEKEFAPYRHLLLVTQKLNQKTFIHRRHNCESRDPTQTVHDQTFVVPLTCREEEHSKPEQADEEATFEVAYDVVFPESPIPVAVEDVPSIRPVCGGEEPVLYDRSEFLRGFEPYEEPPRKPTFPHVVDNGIDTELVTLGVLATIAVLLVAFLVGMRLRKKP